MRNQRKASDLLNEFNPSGSHYGLCLLEHPSTASFLLAQSLLLPGCWIKATNANASGALRKKTHADWRWHISRWQRCLMEREKFRSGRHRLILFRAFHDRRAFSADLRRQFELMRLAGLPFIRDKTLISLAGEYSVSDFQPSDRITTASELFWIQFKLISFKINSRVSRGLEPCHYVHQGGHTHVNTKFLKNL